MPRDINSAFFKDFVCGDLIYGTEIDRERYYSLAGKKTTKFTIDKITRELDMALCGCFGTVAIDNLSPEAFARLPQSGQAFLLFARKVRQWDKMKGTGTNDYTKTGVLKGMPSMKGPKMSGAYFRAKCKVGIGFVLDAGFSIRFVLDSLYTESSMETIARKESYQPWHTGSELRYVYKKREVDLIQKKVVFYVDGGRVDPPWVKFPNAWAEYGKTRLVDEHVPRDYRKEID